MAVWLGRVYVRLGDFDMARLRLESALTAIEASGQLSLLPSAHLALGELEYESGKVRDSLTHFVKAGSLWTDDLPDAASVEARCNQGLIDALDRKLSTALPTVARSIEHASKMGRMSTEAQCRLQLARIQFGERKFAEALAAVDAIPFEGDRTVGREQQARIHYWRSRALRAKGDLTAAESEATRALKLTTELQDSLPATYRDRFGSRRDIRLVLEESGVQEHR